MGLEARNCLNFAALSVTSNTVGVGLAEASPAIHWKVKRAIITVETSDVRWRADGTSPSNVSGHLVDISINPTLKFMDYTYESVLNKIQFCKCNTNAALSISYFE